MFHVMWPCRPVAVHVCLQATADRRWVSGKIYSLPFGGVPEFSVSSVALLAHAGQLCRFKRIPKFGILLGISFFTGDGEVGLLA